MSRKFRQRLDYDALNAHVDYWGEHLSYDERKALQVMPNEININNPLISQLDLSQQGIATGLEKLSEGGNHGWRLIGVDPDGYADIGDNAVDVSKSTDTANQYGASGDGSFASGEDVKASGDYSHVEGRNNVSSGEASHSEGLATTAANLTAHAEGNGTIASGYFSHAENSETIASGISSHAEGSKTKASGTSSHAGGAGTASYYNEASGSAAFSHQTVSANKDAGGDQSAILGGKDNSTTAKNSVVLGGHDQVGEVEDATHMMVVVLKPGTEPSSPVEGTLYYDQLMHKFKYYNGANWLYLYQ